MFSEKMMYVAVCLLAGVVEGQGGPQARRKTPRNRRLLEMKFFKYQIRDGREIWVCGACKRAHAALILLKTWRLIDSKEDDSACERCSSAVFTPQSPALALASET